MPKTILVVDDSASARLIVRETLRSAGYEVIDAADGEDNPQTVPEERKEADLASQVELPAAPQQAEAAKADDSAGPKDATSE